MNNVIKVLAIFAILGLAGCMTTSFDVDERRASATATHDEFAHYFISGWLQRKNVDAVKICGGSSKVAKVQTKTNFVNVILGIVTFSIYTPQKVRVWCHQ